MRRTILTISILSFLVTFCNGQVADKIKIEKVYLEEGDSTKNYYVLLSPPRLPWKGYIALVPGFGETAEAVLTQTELPEKLALNGILTVIPTFQDGVLSFGVDSLSQRTFTTMLKDVRSKHTLSDQRFYVGGFSIGGSCAIKYAENSIEKPSAVFAIDPPLDFERFYNSAKRDIRLSRAGNANPENLYMIDRLEKETGGTPATHLSGYYQLSPYSYSDTTQNAIKKLIHVPIRIYAEPDINWWIKERGADLTGINVTECSAMINELNRLGNATATLITTQDRGFRKPHNVRHPHSWSIVDDDELIKWLLQQE
ncbi:alpha/beta hydrolase [Persicitalea jodogahamensis]|uniref:Alpha/beta hydrolase n=1 Tax=Persicitalea jodogahamensis TaxID=402147 RepID=A0A8J3D382_9BACT|nr:alpha/beta hydrolase [Persicitalea jodogahamensis]GHB65544.1 hypothetical protein GCM10007390_19570 [Persicitalea jodogahamensis]